MNQTTYTNFFFLRARIIKKSYEIPLYSLRSFIYGVFGFSKSNDAVFHHVLRYIY